MEENEHLTPDYEILDHPTEASHPEGFRFSNDFLQAWHSTPMNHLNRLSSLNAHLPRQGRYSLIRSSYVGQSQQSNTQTGEVLHMDLNATNLFPSVSGFPSHSIRQPYNNLNDKASLTNSEHFILQPSIARSLREPKMFDIDTETSSTRDTLPGSDGYAAIGFRAIADPNSTRPLADKDHHKILGKTDEKFRLESYIESTNNQKGTREVVDLTDESQDSSSKSQPSLFTFAQCRPSDQVAAEQAAGSDQAPLSQQQAPRLLVGQKRKRQKNPDNISEAVKAPKRIKVAQPFSAPRVWADRRQQLCEALPYYKSYHASWYTKNGIAYSMLLAKDDDTLRSYKDSSIVISRAPGGLSEVQNKGYMERTKDHTEDDAPIRAIVRAWHERTSIVVLASYQCVGLPSVMPHNFQVLDQHWITDWWWEKDGKRIIFKYRLERCELYSRPWYAPADEEFHHPHFSAICPERVCDSCNGLSKQVYQKWMCLDPKCDQFWKVADGTEPDEETLVFNDAFLKQRTDFQSVDGQIGSDLCPTVFQPKSYEELQTAYSRDGWKGFWCNHCGRCTSREDWCGWKCPCGNSHSIRVPPLTPRQTNVAIDAEGQLSPLHSRNPSSKLKSKKMSIGKYRVDIYDVDQDNRIFHFKSCAELNAQYNGPNQLFRELQLARDMKLKRRIVGPKPETEPTSMLARHFSQNYGLPYKFAVAQDSTPFRNAPQPICHALQRLIWAGKAAGMDQSKSFNEMLVVGYMGGGSMNYHDDGEKELGNTVSALSLGSDAGMRFRYKAKYYFPPLELKPESFTPDESVRPGVPLEKERKAMLDWIKKNPSATEKDMETQFRSSPSVKAHFASRRPKTQPDLVQITLKHGDIVVMEGPDLQKYTEHQVEPLGCLRFALTSRHVLPSTVKPEDIPMGDIDLSAYPEYDGSRDCMGPAGNTSSWNR